MNHFPNFQIDPKRISRLVSSSQWRFILLILGFNILLVATLLLSMHQRELVEELNLVIGTRTIIEEQIIIQEAIEPMTITVVVEPGFTPPATFEP